MMSSVWTKELRVFSFGFGGFRMGFEDSVLLVIKLCHHYRRLSLTWLETDRETCYLVIAMAPFAAEGCKLFVYGIGQHISNDEIMSEFEKFGTVNDTYNTGKG